DDALTQRDRHRVGAVGCAQLVVQVLQMAFYRGLGDREKICDLLAAATFREEFQYLQFAWRERTRLVARFRLLYQAIQQRLGDFRGKVRAVVEHRAHRAQQIGLGRTLQYVSARAES